MRRPRVLAAIGLIVFASLTADTAHAAEPASTPTVEAVEPTAAGLGEAITLRVSNLQQVLDDAQGCANVVLFVDGLPLHGLTPDRCDPDSGHIGFVLKRNPENRDAWIQILGRPTAFERPVQVTVGSSATRSYPRLNNDVTLQLRQVPRAELALFGVIAVAVLVLVIGLGMRTSLLRDVHGDPGRKRTLRPYSLGRTQQAFWFVLAVLAYVFVWLVTDELDSLSQSTLLLIAISSGTALASEAFSRSQVEKLQTQLSQLKSERAKADERHEEVSKAGESAAAVRASTDRLADIDERIEVTQTAIAGQDTQGFLRDLVRDPNGVSLQRLQIMVWTVVLGFIFLDEVYSHLTMPEFSATLLTLMGISSGTYLAGKSTEQAQTTTPLT
jgi:hypothetical protein